MWAALIRKVMNCRKGNMSVMASILAVPLLISVGTVIDYGNMVRIQSQMQSALDAASMQIAKNVTSGMTDAELETFGNQVFLANLDSHLSGDANPPTLTYGGFSTDSDGTEYITADATYDYTLAIIGSVNPLSSLTMKIAVKAKVSSASGDPACVYALSNSAARALEVGGGSDINMSGCVVASDSNASDSIYVGGTSTISADCAKAVGQIDATSGLSVSCDSVRENAWNSPDPFSDIPEPSRPMALSSNPKNTDTTVSPGRYSDLKLDGTKTLEPGTYYIEGSLTIHGDISGTGVFIYMADGDLTINGNASLDLSAPTSGTYAGMLFMSARDNTNPMTFNGSGAAKLDGFIYSAKGDVTYSGSNTTDSTCLRIVADTIKMSGNANMKSDCSTELGGREAKTSGDLYFSL